MDEHVERNETYTAVRLHGFYALAVGLWMSTLRFAEGPASYGFYALAVGLWMSTDVVAALTVGPWHEEVSMPSRSGCG